jgi:PBP1b-binding outer membrane lipoprotein LpoB
MKKYFRVSFIVFAAFLALSACASAPEVSREWTVDDSRQVSAILIEKCLASQNLDEYIENYRKRHNGEKPSVVLQRFGNETSEHIYEDVIALIMKEAIINSGKLDFVAGGELRENIRAERQDQQSYASEDTAVALGNETGAALVLTGNIGLDVTRKERGQARIQDRSYIVSAELVDVETGKSVWFGKDDSVKKNIRQSKARF